MKTLPALRRFLPQILLLAFPFLFAAAWWDKLPPTVPTHWGIHGTPDGWMPKLPGLLGVPLLNVGLCGLLAGLPWIDPRLRRDPAARNPNYLRPLRRCRYALTGFVALAACAIIGKAAGWSFDIGRLVHNGLLVVLAIVGNYFGNLQPNYFFGVRTPWTLEDPATWRATHRVVGRFMVFGALTLLAVGPLVSTAVQAGLLVAFVLVLGLGSLGYSAWFFRQQRLA